MAGVTSYGHLVFEVDLTIVEAALNETFRMAVGLEALTPRATSPAYTKQVRAYVTAIRRRHAQLRREWSNTKEAFEEPTPSHESRMKRFILGAIALITGVFSSILGLFNTAQLTAISNSAETVDGQHLVEVLQNHETRLTLLEDRVLRLNGTLMRVLSHLRQAEDEEHLTATFALVDSYVSSVETQTARYVRGLVSLLNHRVTPELVDSTTMRQALRRLASKARKQGYMLTTEGVAAPIYMLPVSFLVQNQKVQVFIHVPLLRRGSILALYEFIPFPLPIPSSDGYLQLESEEQFIAVNEEQSGYLPLNANTVRDCPILGNLMYCEHSNILYKDFSSSCLSALYSADYRAVKERCHFTVSSIRSKVQQLSPTLFLVFHPKISQLRIDCPTKAAEVHNFVGPKLIEVDPNCRGNGHDYSFLSEFTFNLNFSVINMEFELPLNISFDSLPSNNLQRILVQQGKVTVKDLTKEFAPIHHSNSPWLWVAVTCGLGLLIILGVVWCKRTRSNPTVALAAHYHHSPSHEEEPHNDPAPSTSTQSNNPVSTVKDSKSKIIKVKKSPS